MKDFINIADFSSEQLTGLLERAISDKKLFRAGKLPASCQRKVLALIFEKPSLRTRVSFEAAIVHLGGAAINLTNTDIGLGSREPVSDVAAVLGRMCDAVVARTFSHETVQGLAEHCSKPVINALTDYSHPCQAMADIMTAMEIFGDVRGRKLAFIGDGNNVARSLAILCEKLGMEFALACPEGYELEKKGVRSLFSPSQQPHANRKSGGGEKAPDPFFFQTRDPREAVEGASIIYTDTWISMGQEDEKNERIATFKPYQVNAELLAAAPKDAVVMHCLPAYRGYEITDEVMSAHAGTIFEEAENRLHIQRTLLHVLIAGRKRGQEPFLPIATTTRK